LEEKNGLESVLFVLKKETRIPR